MISVCYLLLVLLSTAFVAHVALKLLIFLSFPNEKALLTNKTPGRSEVLYSS